MSLRRILPALALAAIAGVAHARLDDSPGIFAGGVFGAAVVEVAPGAGGSGPPRITILVPSVDPSGVSTTPTTVTGSTLGIVTTVTWSDACSPTQTACSLPTSSSFSCVVAQTRDCAASQTLTVTAAGPTGVGTDANVVIFPPLQVPAGRTTANDLPTTVTLSNGFVLENVESCDATSAGGLTCTPDSVAEAGAGASPTTSTLTTFHAHDSTERSLRFISGGKRLSPSTSSTLDITTEDFLVEVVFQNPLTVSSNAFLDKSIASTAGWALQGSGSQLSLSLRTASTTTSVTGNTQGIAGTSTTYNLFWVDRDENSTNGAGTNTNGAAGNTANMSARSGSLSNGVVAAIGAPSGGSPNGTRGIVAVRVLKCPISNPQCFPGGAANPIEFLALGRDHTGLVFGAQPLLAAGPDGATTMSRTTIALNDVVDGTVRHLYDIDRTAPLVARRAYSSTAYAGILQQAQATNILLRSQELQTTWAAISVGDNVLTDTWTPPLVLGGATGDDVDCVGVTDCGVRQTATETAATTTFSGWPRDGQQTEVALRTSHANTTTFFDLAACAACAVGEECPAAVDTTGSAVLTARAGRYPVDSTGDGVADEEACRVEITYTGTAAAIAHDLLCALADNNLVIPLDADALANCGWWGVQVEAGAVATSYIATTTAPVVRGVDNLRFDGAAHYDGTPTTIDVKLLCPTYNIEGNNTLLAVGTSTVNFNHVGINGVSDRPRTAGTVASVGQWDISSSTGDVTDGAIHSLRGIWATNDIEGVYDGASFGTDTSSTLVPSSGSFVSFGSLFGAQHPHCIIIDTRIWPRKVTFAEAQ